MKETIQLFSPGPLGTCWYGKYHYLEPWVGCEHACPYCYARSRNVVNNTLSEKQTQFNKPVPLYPEETLLKLIKEKADSGEINILKLSRYTDIFTPSFVENGLSFKILNILAKSKINRIIITSKGLPDEKIIKLMADNKDKFSYNAAARPSADLKDSPLRPFDANLKPLNLRMEAAAKVAASGVKTAIHLDPFVAGYDDTDEALNTFFDMLKKLKLNRVMFSYLLLSEGIMGSMRQALGKDFLDKLANDYNFVGTHTVLPNQEDTASQSLKNEIIKKSVEKTAGELDKREFEFVLCSLKSVRGLDVTKYKRNMICDGTFYA